jgi:hypothetical protein
MPISPAAGAVGLSNSLRVAAGSSEEVAGSAASSAKELSEAVSSPDRSDATAGESSAEVARMTRKPAVNTPPVPRGGVPTHWTPIEIGRGADPKVRRAQRTSEVELF